MARQGGERMQMLAWEQGSRQQNRLRMRLPAVVTTPDGTRHVVLEDLSLRGARVRSEASYRPGMAVVVQWHSGQAIGTVRWVDKGVCGVGFTRSLAVSDLLSARDLEFARLAAVDRDLVRRTADAFVNGRVRL